MNEERKIPVEEVDSVEAPRKARVDDDTSTARETMERKRDYLDGFLKQAPVETSSGEPGGDIYEGVIKALKEIYDPEIPVKNRSEERRVGKESGRTCENRWVQV